MSSSETPASELASAAPEPAPRRWLRSHASSKLLALVCLAVLAVANVSGYVRWEWERQETGKPYAWHHGWPWTFLTRDGTPDPVFGLPTFDRDLWALNKRVIEVDSVALIGNVAAGLGLTLLIAGAFEWRRRRRLRLLQLTISDLAGITFLVAAVLGYGTWRYRTWQRQAEAIERCQSSVDESWESFGYCVNEGTPAWLRKLLPGDVFRPFDHVALIEIENVKPSFNERQEFTYLRCLELFLDAHWDGDSSNLRGLYNLRHLYLFGEGVDDRLLGRFAKCRKLESLSVEGEFTPRGLLHLSTLTELKSLTLVPYEWTEADVAQGDYLHALAALTNLRMLAISEVSMSDSAQAGWAHLSNLKRLESLDLTDTDVADAGMATIGRLDNLRVLRLERTQVGDAGVAHLTGLTKLVELWLYGTRVTDAGVVHLERMPALEHVDLRNTAVTAEGVARLRAKLPRALVVYTPRPEEVEGRGSRVEGEP